MKREKNNSGEDEAETGVHLEEALSSATSSKSAVSSWDSEIPAPAAAKTKQQYSSYLINVNTGFPSSTTSTQRRGKPMSQSDGAGKQQADSSRKPTTVSSKTRGSSGTTRTVCGSGSSQQPVFSKPGAKAAGAGTPHSSSAVETMVVQSKESILTPRCVKDIQQNTKSISTRTVVSTSSSSSRSSATVPAASSSSLSPSSLKPTSHKHTVQDTQSASNPHKSSSKSQDKHQPVQSVSSSSSSTKTTSAELSSASSPLSKPSGSKSSGLISRSVLDKFRKLPVPKRDKRKRSGGLNYNKSPPITPESKSDCTAYATFSFGSDSEDEEETYEDKSGGACTSTSGETSSYSVVKDTSLVVTSLVTSSSTAAHKQPESCTVTEIIQQNTTTTSRERKRGERNKLRFKKILRPIQRSHSAGCAKDAPAYALFLKHQQSEERGERHSVDTGHGGSMDRSDSDSESEESSSATGATETTTTKQSQQASRPKKKSLAQEMKEKFAFLRRRHTDTSISGSDSGEKPTPEVALDWSKSFDNLLNHRYGLELFREFLRTEFSDENIEFWIACEEYKTLKSANYTPLAQKIYSDYVAIQAPREVNLTSKIRLKTVENLDNPDKDTFEVAQKKIEALMARDSYPRFLQSNEYQQLLGEYKHRLKLKS